MVRVEDMNLLPGIRDVGCFPGSVDGESETFVLWGHIPGLGTILNLSDYFMKVNENCLNPSSSLESRRRRVQE